MARSLQLGALALAVPFFTAGVIQAQSKSGDANVLLTPHVLAGSSLSDITYRVIALHGQGFSDRVAQMPATGTFTFLQSADPTVVKWNFSARMDGSAPIENASGEYRDGGRTQCFKDKCNMMMDASSPFYNPTFWGSPTGQLKVGQSWTVRLDNPWELGPAGTQTVTVLMVDKQNGLVMLKREGHGVGPWEGKHETTTDKKGQTPISVTTKYGDAHWVGQAVFQHGVTVSDELLTVTDVEINSPETGTIQAEERQYMSLLEHPDPIQK